MLIKYLFKKFGLPEIKEKRSEKFNLFKNLRNQHKDLIDQNALATKEIRDQEKLFEMLSTKIQAWNNAREKQEEEIRNTLKQIKTNHKNRIDSQTENIYQQKIIGEVFPRVIEGTYKQLEQKFSKEQEAQAFLKGIINHMEKSTQ